MRRTPSVGPKASNDPRFSDDAGDSAGCPVAWMRGADQRHADVFLKDRGPLLSVANRVKIFWNTNRTPQNETPQNTNGTPQNTNINSGGGVGGPQTKFWRESLYCILFYILDSRKLGGFFSLALERTQ